MFNTLCSLNTRNGKQSAGPHYYTVRLSGADNTQLSWTITVNPNTSTRTDRIVFNALSNAWDRKSGRVWVRLGVWGGGRGRVRGVSFISRLSLISSEEIKSQDKSRASYVTHKTRNWHNVRGGAKLIDGTARRMKLTGLRGDLLLIRCSIGAARSRGHAETSPSLGTDPSFFFFFFIFLFFFFFFVFFFFSFFFFFFFFFLPGLSPAKNGQSRMLHVAISFCVSVFCSVFTFAASHHQKREKKGYNFFLFLFFSFFFFFFFLVIIV